METHRTDRVVRILTGLVSFAYYGAWAAAVLVVIVAPLLKVLAPSHVADPSSRLQVPVNLPGLGPTAVSQWTAAPPGIRLSEVTGDIGLPMRLLPVWIPVARGAALVVVFSMVLAFLHHLRVLFRRVRDGTPFDRTNATRMRWLGVLLLALYVFFGVFEYWMSVIVARTLASSSIPIAPRLHINWFVVFIALVLVGLAEVFRRGAALEEEQSLVV